MSYSLEELSKQYEDAKLHPRELELVTDDELQRYVSHWIWKYVYLVVWIFSILFAGWMNS